MTSLRTDARPLGVQTPRVALEPRAARTEADDAAFLSSRYGLTPDPWQMTVLRSWLGLRGDGRWSATRAGLAVPRQNGKNAVIEIRELFGMVVLGEKFLHTAHEVKTARKAFKRLASFFENEREWPELAAMVEEIRKTNGQEAVVLTNGGACEFVARSKGSGRGYTVDTLVMDEAQELSEDALEALLPTISASPLGNPQQILTGTPPGPKASGEIFTRLRNDGLEGKDRHTSWHEWSCVPDADLDDPRSLASANPALGGRLQWEVCEAERATMSDAGYGRERLGMWDEASSARVIDPLSWDLCVDDTSRAVGRLALAVDVNPDRTVAAVALAGQRADGKWHVELDEQRNGTGWIVDYVAQRCARNDIRAVVVDAASPAATVIEGLSAKRIKVTTTGPRDMTHACGSFFDAVMQAELRHIDQPQLNFALGSARKRALGDAWAWNRRNATSDITPLVACTLALWGSQSSAVKKPSRSGTGRRAAVVL